MNLYELLGYHRKNSILRSVTVTDEFDSGTHFRLVEVEPYDDTGVNGLDTTPSRYDNSIKTIENGLHYLEMRMLKSNKGWHKINRYRVCIYSNAYEPFEFIFDPVTMEEW